LPLYRLFTAALYRKTVDDLEDFIAYLDSFYGEGGKFVDARTLLKMISKCITLSTRAGGSSRI
jgi:hypothetical protein